MDTFYLVGSVVLFFATIFVVLSRHKASCNKFDATVRAKFDAEGSFSDAARQMMREAGYNI